MNTNKQEDQSDFELRNELLNIYCDSSFLATQDVINEMMAVINARQDRAVAEALKQERKRRKLGKKRRIETEAHIKKLSIPRPLPRSHEHIMADSGNEAERC